MNVKLGEDDWRHFKPNVYGKTLVFSHLDIAL